MCVHATYTCCTAVSALIPAAALCAVCHWLLVASDFLPRRAVVLCRRCARISATRRTARILCGPSHGRKTQITTSTRAQTGDTPLVVCSRCRGCSCSSISLSSYLARAVSGLGLAAELNSCSRALTYLSNVCVLCCTVLLLRQDAGEGSALGQAEHGDTATLGTPAPARAVADYRQHLLPIATHPPIPPP